MDCSDLHLTRIRVVLHDCAKIEAWLNRVVGNSNTISSLSYSVYGDEVYLVCLTPYEKRCLEAYAAEINVDISIVYFWKFERKSKRGDIVDEDE